MYAEQPIVIIDDDPDDLGLIKEVCKLLKIPNRIILFNDAEGVLNYLAQEKDHPFLILCDINMPKMNGLELREIIYNNDELNAKAIPFVFLSTAASQSQVDAAYRLTVQGYFEKGSSFDRLQNKLKLIFEYWKECKHPQSDGLK
jgi:DNA-binding NarL/FixJ family response regulator